MYVNYNLKKNNKQHPNDTQIAPFDTQYEKFGCCKTAPE